jgi:hypothetical protein
MPAPMIDRALATARSLAAALPLATEKGKDNHTGREFDFVPARELVRAAGVVLPQASLSLRARGESVSQWGLTVTYRLTHADGDFDEWTAVTPLSQSVRPELAIDWARTHSLKAAIRSLLWIGSAEAPDPCETGQPKATEQRSQRQVQEDERRARSGAALPERNGSGRSTKTSRATAALADSMVDTPVSIEHGDEEREKEAAMDLEAARLAAQPTKVPPVSDPDWYEDAPKAQAHQKPTPIVPPHVANGYRPDLGEKPYVAAEERRCRMVCPHGSRCRLDAGHEEEGWGCSHLPAPEGCACNEPNEPMPDGPTRIPASSSGAPRSGVLDSVEEKAKSPAAEATGPSASDAGPDLSPPAPADLSAGGDGSQPDAPDAPSGGEQGAVSEPPAPATPGAGAPPACGARDPVSPRACDRPAGHDGDHEDSRIPVDPYPPPALSEPAACGSCFDLLPEDGGPCQSTECQARRAKEAAASKLTPEDARARFGHGSPEHRDAIRRRAAEKGEATCSVHGWVLVRDALGEDIAPWCTECTDLRREGGASPEETPHALPASAEWKESPAERTSIDAAAAQGRKDRAARWGLCPPRSVTTRTKVEACALCGLDVDSGPYRQGVEGDPSDLTKKRRGSKPVGRAHQACVDALARGEDPKSEGAEAPGASA